MILVLDDKNGNSKVKEIAEQLMKCAMQALPTHSVDMNNEKYAYRYILNPNERIYYGGRSVITASESSPFVYITTYALSTRLSGGYFCTSCEHC